MNQSAVPQKNHRELHWTLAVHHSSPCCCRCQGQTPRNKNIKCIPEKGTPCYNSRDTNLGLSQVLLHRKVAHCEVICIQTPALGVRTRVNHNNNLCCKRATAMPLYFKQQLSQFTQGVCMVHRHLHNLDTKTYSSLYQRNQAKNVLPRKLPIQRKVMKSDFLEGGLLFSRKPRNTFCRHSCAYTSETFIGILGVIKPRTATAQIQNT